MSRSNFTGKRALITGASSGIGVEFADLLAAQKVNLVLAARRREPMEKLAADLRRKYGIEVLVEPIDLASPGAGARLKTVSTNGRYLSTSWSTTPATACRAIFWKRRLSVRSI